MENVQIKIIPFTKYEFKQYFNGTKWKNKTSGAFLARPALRGSQETPPTRSNNEKNNH